MAAKQLTPRQSVFVKAVVEGKSNTEAAMMATGAKTKDVAKTQGHRLSTNVNVQEALAKAFKKHAISLDAAIAPIGKALKATKVVIHGNGEDAFAEVVEDLDMQLKGSDRALKLMGVSSTGDTNITFIDMSNRGRKEYDL